MADMQSLIERLEKAVTRLEGAVPSGAVVPPSSRDISVPGIGELSSAITPSVSEFDSLIDSAVHRVLAPAQKIGGQVLEGSKILEQAFLAERSVILAISKCKKPDMNGLQKLVQPLAEVIQKASRLTEGKRTDAFNHLKVIAESLTALTWVVFTEKGCGMSFPATHVEETWQAAEYYNNKVLVEYRNKNADHTEWARAMKELFVPTLRDYTKKYHVTGPNWNIQGVEVSNYSSGGVAATPSARATAPPPPPPRGNPPPPPAAPPMLSHSLSDSKPSGSQPSMNAVFQEINRGEGIASGLRKVTADMKSKNRTDKSGVVAASESKSERSIAPTKVKQASPKFELEMDRKWVIENQIGNKSLVISKCNAWQSVYIFGCKDSVIQINGKVNNITMDKCTKTGIVFKDVVAACEMVNCISVEVQCQGSVPSIMIDNTTGCQLYLSKSSLSASITSARSSEINVLVPGLTDEADLVEHALPEQFFHVFNNGSFVTTPVKHTSG